MALDTHLTYGTTAAGPIVAPWPHTAATVSQSIMFWLFALPSFTVCGLLTALLRCVLPLLSMSVLPGIWFHCRLRNELAHVVVAALLVARIAVRHRGNAATKAARRDALAREWRMRIYAGPARSPQDKKAL